MARTVLTTCDACGEPGEDVRTYTVRTEGAGWEVDLDNKHAEALLKVARKGRELGPSTVTSDRFTRALESRIRR